MNSEPRTTTRGDFPVGDLTLCKSGLDRHHTGAIIPHRCLVGHLKCAAPAAAVSESVAAA